MLTPIYDTIIAQIDKPEQTSASGFIIPESVQDRPQYATVIAVGPGRHTNTGDLIPTPFTTGDTILYNPYAGREITHEGETYLILQPAEVIAITAHA